MTTATATPSAKPAARPRRAVVPPKTVTKTMSVFEYLSQCQPPLADKIIEIACSQTQVPMDLRPDARQEISLMWSQMTPDTEKYKPGQIAAYAHQMARHAALRARRDLGSPVRLPGSAFRKRRDGTSYVTPGVLAAALDWNELEGWFQTDEAGSSPASAALRDDFGAVSLTELDEAQAAEDTEEALVAERVRAIQAAKPVLTERQYSIMLELAEGSTFDEVMTKLNIKRGVLMREVAIASSVLSPADGF